MTKLEEAENELRWRAKGGSLDLSVEESKAIADELDRLRARVIELESETVHDLVVRARMETVEP